MVDLRTRLLPPLSFGILNPIEASVDCSLFVALFPFVPSHPQKLSHISAQPVVVHELVSVEGAYQLRCSIVRGLQVLLEYATFPIVLVDLKYAVPKMALLTVVFSEIRELTAPCHTDFVNVLRMNSAVPFYWIWCSELLVNPRSEIANYFVVRESVFLGSNFMCYWQRQISSALRTSTSLSEMRLKLSRYDWVIREVKFG